MFYFLLLGVGSINCSSNEGLEDGYICCDNISCLEKYCYVVTSTYTTTRNGIQTTKTTITEQCLTEKEYKYCFIAYPTIIICILCCILPTLIALFAQCACGFSIPKSTIYYNIGSNISIGMLISVFPCFNVMSPLNIVMLVFGIIGSIILCIFERVNLCKGCEECAKCCGCCGGSQDSDVDSIREVRRLINKETARLRPIQCTCCANCCQCCCDTEDDLLVQNNCCVTDSLEVLNEIRAPIVSKDALESIIVENSAIPPTPQAEAFSYQRGRKGSLIITGRATAPIQYGSWQETGAKLPVITNIEKSIVYKCKQTYTFENNMTENIAAAQSAARAKVYQPSIVHNIYQTTGQTKNATAISASSNLGCFTSCFIKDFLYNILMFFGYNGLIDACWRSKITTIKYVSHKLISADKNLRALAGERDRSVYNNESNEEYNKKMESVTQQGLL
jgi:hypothetical protein